MSDTRSLDEAGWTGNYICGDCGHEFAVWVMERKTVEWMKNKWPTTGVYCRKCNGSNAVGGWRPGANASSPKERS